MLDSYFYEFYNLSVKAKCKDFASTDKKLIKTKQLQKHNKAMFESFMRQQNHSLLDVEN